MADINGDGAMDVVGASHYDSSIRWFENDGNGVLIEHLISSAVNERQGVTVADIDNDGDANITTASSGDNTIAVFTNMGDSNVRNTETDACTACPDGQNRPEPKRPRYVSTLGNSTGNLPRGRSN